MDHGQSNRSFFEPAAARLNATFASIAAARAESQSKLSELNESVDDLEFSESTALVVFGSLARREWTQGSDVDWTLLIDGPSSLEHHQLALDIQSRLENRGFVEPGTTGTFGCLVSSHDLLHHIGGINDTNLNMTRRLLLLLESHAVGGSLTRELVIRRLLKRYVDFGGGVADRASHDLSVPRFLLNDFVRLWRTFAVDYAAKKWLEGDK